MIQLVHKDGVASVVLTCDVCGEPITDAGMAIVRWKRSKDLDNIVTDLEFCHKGACDKQIEEYLRYPCWELRHFLARLVVSTGTPPENIVEVIREASAIGLMSKTDEEASTE
jgi:hypothetical protein